MVKQWHNTKIPKKPFTRYNPSYQQNIASVYRCWYLLVAILSIIIGIALIGCSVALRQYDSNLKNELFHLWVALPLIASGVFALACFVFKKKSIATAFLIIVIVVMVVCATGALATGIRYWMDEWKQTKGDLGDDKCSVKDNVCVCPGVDVGFMPTKIDSCDDLKVMVILVITEIALCAAGFVASVMGVYLAFMSICCGIWMYAEWYDESNDPDFSKKSAVKQTGGKVNLAYGN